MAMNIFLKRLNTFEIKKSKIERVNERERERERERDKGYKSTW